MINSILFILLCIFTALGLHEQAKINAIFDKRIKNIEDFIKRIGNNNVNT